MTQQQGLTTRIALQKQPITLGRQTLDQVNSIFCQTNHLPTRDKAEIGTATFQRVHAETEDTAILSALATTSDAAILTFCL